MTRHFSRRVTASPLSQPYRRIAYTLILLLLIANPLPVLAAPSAQSAAAPLVLAFYYTWFDENTWTYDKLSDLPAEPYVSRDRGVMGRHIDQARAAGIDAFLVAWYGPGGGPNQTETNLAAMLDEANARGFKVGVLFETTSPFFGGIGDVTAALQHLLNTHANHPAFLRADGRPVIFFWRPTLYGVDAWRNVRSQVDPNYSSIWISEGVDTSYLAVFDGHHLYSNTWNPPADLTSVNAKFAGQVAQASQNYGTYKLWVATVMPGYNDVRIRPGAGFATDRGGGSYFTQSWQAAIASNPNWIVINSFNEWPEGSYIEPSVAFGDHFINLSGQYSAQFKAGGGISEAATAPPPPMEPPPTPTPRPEPTEPTAFVDAALLNLRAGPSTDSEIVGQAAAGAALPIQGQHPAWPDWWQVRHGEQTAWVYAPLVTTGGPMEQVAVLDDAALPAGAATVMTAAVVTGDSDPATALSAEVSAEADNVPVANVFAASAPDTGNVAEEATDDADNETTDTAAGEAAAQATSAAASTQETVEETVATAASVAADGHAIPQSAPQLDANYDSIQPYLAR